MLKQIEEKGAVVSWCPLAENANMVALGTKVMPPHNSTLMLQCVLISFFIVCIRIPLELALTTTAENWRCTYWTSLISPALPLPFLAGPKRGKDKATCFVALIFYI
ncbi:hypothetical protein EON64_05945 [archaeon]|nr:MAG: hypothetical protein EON64_05945 [archaeon]